MHIKAWDVLLIGAGASFWPLTVLAQNAPLATHPERLVGFAMIVWAVGIAAVWVLNTLGVSRQFAVNAVFVGTVLFMTGGRVLARFDGLTGWALLVASGALVLLLLHRLSESAILTPVIAGLAVAVLSSPLVSVISTWGGQAKGAVVAEESLDISMQETPDIYLVMLDGYPGLMTLQREFEVANEDLVLALNERSFDVPSQAWSAYPRTNLSLSSVLDMSYPVVTEFGQDGPEERLHEIIAGDNALVDVLASNGYAIQVIESGWSGLSCGSMVDECVSSHLLNEALHLTLRDTLLRRVVRSTLGHAFTVGTQRTMRTLRSIVGDNDPDGTPRFVLAHLIAPHPPFYLDENCERMVEDSRDGWSVDKDGLPDLASVEGFYDQMKCVDRFMVELADSVSPEDVIVFASDHGTDRRLQTLVPADAWSRNHLVERLNVFVAVRSPGCEIGETVILPNVFRRILSCYSDTPIPDVETRMFMTGGVEVDQATVGELFSNS